MLLWEVLGGRRLGVCSSSSRRGSKCRGVLNENNKENTNNNYAVGVVEDGGWGNAVAYIGENNINHNNAVGVVEEGGWCNADACTRDNNDNSKAVEAVGGGVYSCITWP